MPTLESLIVQRSGKKRPGKPSGMTETAGVEKVAVAKIVKAPTAPPVIVAAKSTKTELAKAPKKNLSSLELVETTLVNEQKKKKNYEKSTQVKAFNQVFTWSRN